MPLCCWLSPLLPQFFPAKPLAASSSPRTSARSSTAGHSFQPTFPSNRDIRSLCKEGDLDGAFHALSLHPSPSRSTYIALMQACARRNATSHARALHRRVSADGLDQDLRLSEMLVVMYSELGDVASAREVFAGMREVFAGMRERTTFACNTLLRALALAREGHEALTLCREMAQSDLALDRFSYSFALKACLHLSSLRGIREIHCRLLRVGLASRVHVATTLLDAYAKLSRVDCAEKVFNRMRRRNVVTWSAMIASYVHSERPIDALDLFRELVVHHGGSIVPNSVTIVSVLQACGDLCALEQGRLFHAYALRRGLDSILSLQNALVGMYIKCGCLELGCRIFDKMGGRRDVVSWNTMISGLGVHGFGKQSVRLFHEMMQSGVAPNQLSFLSVLTACSHAGLVREGKELFKLMSQTYGITPQNRHYSCLVDLLGRAGHLDEASRVVDEMQIEPGPTVWGALLGACRIHGNIKLAERAFQRLLEFEPTNAGNYALLGRIYAEAKMYDGYMMTRELLRDYSLRKWRGCSSIEVKKKVYSFSTVDEMDPVIIQVDSFLAGVLNAMKTNGYVPETKLVLYDLGQAEKERILLTHTAKRALAFGLVNTSSRVTIRISKNQRLCEDCHSFTKFISRLTRREIFVRDVNRAHLFKDGVCSCGDYW